MPTKPHSFRSTVVSRSGFTQAGTVPIQLKEDMTAIWVYSKFFTTSSKGFR